MGLRAKDIVLASSAAQSLEELQTGSDPISASIVRRIRALRPILLKGFAPSVCGILCQLASRILALFPHNPAPTQAHEVVSGLSADQTPPLSARIPRVALAPNPVGLPRPRSWP